MSDQKIPELWSNWTFWVVVIGAASFKAIKSPDHTFMSRLVSAASAVFAAVAFAPGVIDYFAIAGDGMKIAVSALVAITGEHLMALAIVAARDPRAAINMWREWMGKGKQ